VDPILRKKLTSSLVCSVGYVDAVGSTQDLEGDPKDFVSFCLLFENCQKAREEQRGDTTFLSHVEPFKVIIIVSVRSNHGRKQLP
jgi:hypothetical protein